MVRPRKLGFAAELRHWGKNGFPPPEDQCLSGRSTCGNGSFSLFSLLFEKEKDPMFDLIGPAGVRLSRRSVL